MVVGDVRLTSPATTAQHSMPCSTPTPAPGAPRIDSFVHIALPVRTDAMGLGRPAMASGLLGQSHHSCTRSMLLRGCFRINAPRQHSSVSIAHSRRKRLVVSYYQIAVFGLPVARTIRTASPSWALPIPTPSARNQPCDLRESSLSLVEPAGR